MNFMAYLSSNKGFEPAAKFQVGEGLTASQIKVLARLGLEWSILIWTKPYFQSAT